MYKNKDKEKDTDPTGGSCSPEEDEEERETEPLVGGESDESLCSQKNHYGSSERVRDLHELSSHYEYNSGSVVEEKPQQVEL